MRQNLFQAQLNEMNVVTTHFCLIKVVKLEFAFMHGSHQIVQLFQLLGHIIPLKYQPHHSHIMMIFGDLAIVSTIPCIAYTSIDSTSMSTKSITVPLGRTLSTRSSVTQQQVSPVLLAPLKPGFVLIRAPPVFPLSTSLVPLIVTLLAPILQATALSSNSLRQIFFSSIGYDRSVGSKANIFPFGPTPLANTIAQIPMCAPRFSIVSPYFTSLAMALRLCGYQVPLDFILLETIPSKSSTTRLTPQIVETKTYLSLMQNFALEFLGLLSYQHCTLMPLLSTARAAKASKN